MIAISNDDYLWFIDLALEAMVGIVRQLGDHRANLRPDIAGANSPFAILTHCIGVMEFWGGVMVADRAITRARDEEFRASGAVEELIERVIAGRARFAADLLAADSAAPPRHDPVLPEDIGTPLAATQGGVLIHVLRELIQHLGQMELTRDILTARMT
jgi:hypothetical protein